MDRLNFVCHMYEDVCQNPPKQHGVQSSFLLLSPICAYTNPTGMQLYNPVQQELGQIPADCCPEEGVEDYGEYNRRLKMPWLQSVSAN